MSEHKNKGNSRSNSELLKELRLLSDEELKQASLEKNGRNMYTRRANLAQKVRNERTGVTMFSDYQNEPSIGRIRKIVGCECCCDDYNEESYP